MHVTHRVHLRVAFDGLHTVVDAFGDRQRRALAELGRQVTTFQVLHHHVWTAVVQNCDIDDAGHVFVADTGESACLVPKAGHGVPVSAFQAQKLQSHALLEVYVPRFEHNAHAARTDHAIDAVLFGNQIAWANWTLHLRYLVLLASHGGGQGTSNVTQPRMIFSTHTELKHSK